MLSNSISVKANMGSLNEVTVSVFYQNVSGINMKALSVRLYAPVIEVDCLAVTYFDFKLLCILVIYIVPETTSQVMFNFLESL